MPFWKCYYHIIWATRNREPVITRSNEALLFDAIRAKSAEFHSAILAVNGVPDHVHDSADARLTIPMKPGLRSLNVAMACAMVIGEAIAADRRHAA